MLRKLMEAGRAADVSVHTPDVQQLMAHECVSSPDLKEPHPPHMKEEEQEELCSSQLREQLQNHKDDVTAPSVTLVPVKSEDEEKAQHAQLHHSRTEEGEAETQWEDSGGQEPGRNLDPDAYLQAESPECDTDDSEDDWKQSRTLEVKVNALIVTETGCNAGQRSFSCSQCDARFVRKGDMQRHGRCHTGEKPFACSVCGKSFTRGEHLIRHRRCHSEERPFSCGVCKKRFRLSHHMTTHMRTHTGEKPFHCSFCGKGFCQKADAVKHMRVHTGEKPYTCSVCGRRFTENGTLKTHLTLHTGQRPFTCNACHKQFNRRSLFRRHKCVVDSSDYNPSGGN